MTDQFPARKTSGIPRSVRLLTALLAAAGLGIALASLRVGERIGVHWWALPGLVLLVTAACYLLVDYHYRGEVDSFDLFEAGLALALVALPGWGVVILVVACKSVAERLHRVPLSKASFNVASFAAAAGTASLVYSVLIPHHAGGSSALTGGDVLAVVPAVLVAAAVNDACFVVVLRLVGDQPIRRVLSGLAPIIVRGWVLGLAGNVLLGLLFVCTYAPNRVVWVLFLLLPPLALLHAANRGRAQATAGQTRLAGMQSATHALAVPVNPLEALPAFLLEVRRCFESDGVALHIFAGPEVHVHQLEAGERSGYRVDRRRRSGSAVEAAVGGRCEPARATTRSDDAKLRALLRSEGWHNCLLAPVCSSDGVVRGALCSYNHRGMEGFEQGELAVMEALAREAAAALERAELLDRVVGESTKLAQIVEHSGDGIATVDSRGVIHSWNPSFAALTGYRADEMVGSRGLSRLEPRDPAGAPVAVESWSDGRPLPAELAIRSRDGAQRWLSCSYQPFDQGPDGRGRLILTAHDVTDRKRSEALLTGQTLVLESIAGDKSLTETLSAITRLVEDQSDRSHAVVLLLDESGRTLHLGAAPSLPAAAVARLADGIPVGPGGGWAARTVLERDFVTIPDLTVEPAWLAGDGSNEEAGRAGWAVPVVSSGGQVLGVLAVSARTGSGDDGPPASPAAHDRRLIGLAAHLVEIAVERTRQQARLAHRATHDALTGLPNRSLFLDRCSVALARSRRSDTGVVVLFIDLDRFKFVNDSFGHEAGDRLLVEVAERLRGVVRPGDTVARLGGDEFTVLAEGFDLEGAGVEVAARVHHVLSAPVIVRGAEVFVSASIGIAATSSGGISPEMLLENADSAMYRAKEMGGNRYEQFDQPMRLRVAQRLNAQTSLQRALERSEFEVFYQPVFSLREERLIGAEALLRWRHPERGLLRPEQFLPLAEESGLIVPIGAEALRQVCGQLVRWRSEPAGSDLSVSVNLSCRQFTHPGVVPLVRETLSRTGVEARALAFEINEAALMEDGEVTEAALAQLRTLGVGLTIDDFGTGYTSLSSLKSFPVHALKVDSSFVRGMGKHPADAAIVSAVINLAHTLGLSAMAEGVESAAQLRRLRELGCDVAQGYHLGRPAPARQLALPASRPGSSSLP